MEQMSTEGLTVVQIDLDAPEVPESVKAYHPILFKEGDHLTCVLGPDSVSGIAGTGKTPEGALEDFDQKIQTLIAHPENGNEVSDFVLGRHV